VEVEYAEGSEMGKLERDIGEIVSGEVEFDEWDAFIDGGYFSWSDFGAGKDQQFKAGWILDKLAYL
jgi:hypothetical protein